MSMDLKKDPPIALADVPGLHWIRGRCGGRLHIATVHRWCSRGIGGVRLDYLQLAGRRVTTEAALMAFFSRLTQLPAKDVGKPNQRVEEELDRIGIR